jgi:AraC-like DNA-binding protein
MQELFAFEAPVPFHLFEYSPPDVRGEQHWHSFYEIGYCIEGSGTFYFGDRVVRVSAGDLQFFPPYEPHIAQPDPGRAFRFFFLYFGADLFPDEDRQMLLAFRQTSVVNEQVLRGSNPDLLPLPRFFESMLEEYEARKTGYGALLRSRMLDLCVRLHRLEESLHTRESWNGMLKRLHQVKPARDFIERHFREPLKLQDLAAVLSLSESRTRHLFKASVGKGFKEYLAFARIQEAKRMLAKSDMSVTDIYLASGFQSSAPFYRSFQQLVGYSPLQYRCRLSHQE